MSVKSIFLRDIEESKKNFSKNIAHFLITHFSCVAHYLVMAKYYGNSYYKIIYVYE